MQRCEDLDFADFRDWRLPDRYELTTAVDLEDSTPPVFGLFTVSNNNADNRLSHLGKIVAFNSRYLNIFQQKMNSEYRSLDKMHVFRSIW